MYKAMEQIEIKTKVQNLAVKEKMAGIVEFCDKSDASLNMVLVDISGVWHGEVSAKGYTSQYTKALLKEINERIKQALKAKITVKMMMY